MLRYESDKKKVEKSHATCFDQLSKKVSMKLLMGLYHFIM